jgi:ATP-dependent Lon protease
MAKKTHRTRIQSGAIQKISYNDINKNIDNDHNDDNYIDNDDNDIDNDDNDIDNDDNIDDTSDDNDIDNDNKLNYYKFLNKIFPSNYSKDKIQKCKRQRLNFINEKNRYSDTEMDTDNTYGKNINIYFNLKNNNNTYDSNNEYEKKNNLLDIINDNIQNNYETNNIDDDNIDDDNIDDIDDTNMENIKISIDTDKIPTLKISKENYKKFDKILNMEEDELEYFKTKMTLKQQFNAINELQKLKSQINIDKPYLIYLTELDIPDIFKASALKKINIMKQMSESNSNEYYKLKMWVDTFIKIPFNKYSNLPITYAGNLDECHEFINNARNTLNNVVYGLNDAKLQILQLIGLWLVNPNAIGAAIAINGPPGTGKTTLIKDGISKILSRPFALIALGGTSGGGYLDGHEYTYEGSKYGKIIEILIKSGCMNPVILFDELDKVSNTPGGEEIIGVLTHLTDTTQNTSFSDKYLSEIELDMSKALYIFSYNDESKINPILKDRMYKIETLGYKTQEKIIIAKDFIIPKINEQVKFSKDDIIFTDEILNYIIINYTQNEQGVRNLKRCIEIIYTKLNLSRLIRSDINIFDKDTKICDKIKFPIELTREIVDKLIVKTDTYKLPFGMYT